MRCTTCAGPRGYVVQRDETFASWLAVRVAAALHALVDMSSDPASSVELAQLIELFLACIDEDIGSAARAERARVFNRRYEAYVAEDPEENLSRFARRVSLRGVPYIRAFIQIVQVRGLGVPPLPPPERRRKRPPTKRPRVS